MINSELIKKTGTLGNTNFNFPGQKSFYRGKVREVYNLGDKMVMVATDRISAFDVILPKGIPFKGQVLNQIAGTFLQATSHIVPNWFEASPDPTVTVGKACEPFAVEMVVRGYLAGHAWREYKSGKRSVCGVPLPEGLKENDRLPSPILTPTTKAQEGHDMDISREEIISQGIVAEETYKKLEDYTLKLYAFGTTHAAGRGLILVDTKYEFGMLNGEVVLIDEIHTPDSSRYFYAEGYEERQDNNEAQKHLSKEFVRQWLIENGFQGLDNQKIPEMTPEVIESISIRYVELFEQITGKEFEPAPSVNLEERIFDNVLQYLKT
ncbi:MAG: phosphoribosylaminoimidazole-succinocarboxamide synthase [Sphingobacteriales bacterium]|jgi:phosphoribosylaminoimidazole-succinocarboxamide synthase